MIDIKRHVDTGLEIALLIVRNYERRFGQNRIHIHLITCVGGMAGVGGEADLEPFANLLIDTAVQRDTIVSLGRNNSLVVVIGDTEAIIAFSCASGDIEVVILSVSCAVEQILPIGKLVV
ncbi:unknown [Bacteroides sp. CAG:1060]|nr:unknown [Bacteroides sp. CAG:1060]